MVIELELVVWLYLWCTEVEAESELVVWIASVTEWVKLDSSESCVDWSGFEMET